MKQTLIVIIFLISAAWLISMTQNIYQSLPMGRSWTRHVVTEENDLRRQFHRPRRFEFMEMYTRGEDSIQIRTMLTRRAKSIRISVRVNDKNHRFRLNIIEYEDGMYFAERLILDLPENTQSVFIRTRNPNAFFRHYRIRTADVPIEIEDEYDEEILECDYLEDIEITEEDTVDD